MRAEDLVEGRVLPLLLRVALWVVGIALTSLTLDPAALLGPSLAVAVVLAFGVIPLNKPMAGILQGFAEATALAFVIGTNPELAGAFAPLLLLPVFALGQSAGIATGAAGGFAAALAWSLAMLSSLPLGIIAGPASQLALWVVPLLATGMIGGWLRRLTLENRSRSDDAYEQALRLLSELQQVSRNLSLGLDPTTLGTAILEQVGQEAPRGARSLSVRSGDGRVAPLAASGSAVAPLEPTSAAWTDGVRVSEARKGLQHDSFPMRMGKQVMAVVDVDSEGLSPDEVRGVEAVLRDNGPKLAAALVFDEVRQLATVDERLRLAREIHDGVAQELASVGYLLDDLASRAPEETGHELGALRDHVRTVVGELRLSIFDLRSGVDDSIGLGTALSEHVQRVGQQSDLVVHTVLDEHGERLPAGTEVELLRIAQEAVTNVRKHARASNLWVECTVDAPRAWVRIADDGIGMQPARPQSMGQRGMRERAARIGGDLTLGERPGGGTVVEVSIGDWDERRGGDA